MRDLAATERSAWGRLRRWARSRRAVVVDGSMAPALLPGDRVRFDRGSYRRRPPSVGEIVVLADPEGRVSWLVKRVTGVDPVSGTLEVRGDAEGASRDSRRFGPVPLEAVAGRVYRVYLPWERRRAL